jgi:hypothetical protein
MTTREYLADWDPMKFISDGAPVNEYDAEADEIRVRYKGDISDKKLGELVHSVFVEFMEIDPVGFKEECLRRAVEVRRTFS